MSTDEAIEEYGGNKGEQEKEKLFGSDGSWRNGSGAFFRVKSEGFVSEKKQFDSCANGVDSTEGGHWHEVVRHLMWLLL